MVFGYCKQFFFFWAPTGAQGFNMSICLFTTSLFKSSKSSSFLVRAIKEHLISQRALRKYII